MALRKKLCLFSIMGLSQIWKDTKTKTKTHKEEIKQSEDNITKDVRNLFRFLKESEVIKDKIPRDIRTLFESEKKKIVMNR